MRLPRFLRRAEGETDQEPEGEDSPGVESAGAVLIRELIEGDLYEFGEPWQLTSDSLSAVVPILRRLDQGRDYWVLQEIPKDKLSVTDSGGIAQVSVMVKGRSRPVFVRAGTIFKGQGTQSRTSSMGVMLEPGRANVVDVFCVHASHRISARAGFSAMRDVVPRKVEDVLTSPLRSQQRIWKAAAIRRSAARVTQCPDCGSSRLLQTYEAELVCMQCGFVVAPVQRRHSDEHRDRGARAGAPLTFTMHTHRTISRRANDNLVANLGELRQFNRAVETMLSKIPADLEKQVGVVIIDSRAVLGLEMFDHPDSWRAFSRSIVRNYADILAKERAGDGLFELKTERVPHAITKFLEKAQTLSERTVFRSKSSETRMLSGKLAGEYTTLGSNAVHLLLKRHES